MAKFTEKQQAACGTITEMNQVILSSNPLSCKSKASIIGNNYNLFAGNANYDATEVGKNETEIVVPLRTMKQFLENFKYTIN